MLRKVANDLCNDHFIGGGQQIYQNEKTSGWNVEQKGTSSEDKMKINSELLRTNLKKTSGELLRTSLKKVTPKSQQ